MRQRLAALCALATVFSLALASASAVEANGAALLKGIRYTYSVEPNSSPDPGHIRLVDGNPAPVIWYQQLNVIVDLDLGSSYVVQKVEVDAYRGAGARSRLRNMTLFTDDGGGYVTSGSMTDIFGADYALPLVTKLEPGGDPVYLVDETPRTLTFDNIARECCRVRLALSDGYQRGWHFGICEVRVYGTPVAEQVTRKPTNLTDAELLAPYPTPEAKDSVILQEANLDQDADMEILLANKYVRLVIKPSLGGVISGFSYRGVEFTQPKNPSAPGGGGGLLSDHVSTQPCDGDWFNAPYRYRIAEQSPARASVQLSATGRSGSLMYLTFTKTITLEKDRSDVQVDYEIALSDKATVPLPFNFWFHNYVGVRDGLARSPSAHLFAPVDTGVREVAWNDEKASSLWFLNPVRGWTGMADTKRRTGIVFGMDYRYLRNFYSWGAQGSNALPTLEWRLNEVTVPDGKTFRTSVRLVPFRGLARVDEMAGSIVGSLDLSQGKLTADLYSTRAVEGTATMRIRRLPDGQWRKLAENPVKLAADEPLALTAPCDILTTGTHILSLVLRKGEETLIEVERPVTVGAASGMYTMKPNEERVEVSAAPVVRTRFASMEHETPHVPWARPYQGGKTKAIVLIDGCYQREVIELAERMDLELDTTYLFPGNVVEALSDFYGRTSVQDLRNGLNRLLSDNPDWDVLVMAGHMFRYFTKEQQDSVLKHVTTDGAGLVVVQPDETHPLPKLSPLQGRKPYAPGAWKAEKSHFITTGVPFPALPATPDIYEYTPAKDAEVLAIGGARPLIAVRQAGKGRVVAMAYRAGDHAGTLENPGNFCGLTPFMVGPGGTNLAPEMPSFKYHEYYFSLLAKATLWAARKEPKLLIENVAASPRGIELSLDNHGAAQNVDAFLTVEDKTGSIVTRDLKQTIAVAAGKSVQAILFAAPLPEGMNLADVSLRTADGKVINWASVPVAGNPPLHISGCSLDKTVYSPGDMVNVAIRIEGAPDAEAGLRVTLRDGYGRVTAEKALPVAAGIITCALPIENPINPLLSVRVELKRGADLLDVSEDYRILSLPLSANAHDGEMTLLGWNNTAIYGMNSYLAEPYFKMMSDMGFNASLNTGADMTPALKWACLRNNMQLQTRGMGISLGGDRIAGDRAHPTRIPCLNDPVWLASARDWMKAMAAPDVGYSGAQGDDEAPYAPEDLDFCFCDKCMAGMRQWLQEQYPSLEALNQEWGTQFGKWDAVKPFTLAECTARGDGNFAPWSDHRSFEEVSVAKFFRMMAQTAQETRPGTLYGPSGNPCASVYGGYDFWQMRDSYSMLHSYSGTDELGYWGADNMHIIRYCAFDGVDATRARMFGDLFYGIKGIAVCGTQRLPAPDWTYSRAGWAYHDNWTPVKRGLGRILNESRRTPDAFAVHYSRNATRIAYILGHRALWEEVRYSSVDMFNQVGLDNGWLSYEQLEDGKTDGWKVIYMPMSCTLNPKEVTALERFVREGGALIAEFAPGIADGHGRMLPQGGLDAVFGVTRKDSRIIARSDASVRTGAAGGLRFPELTIGYVETGLQKTSAEVLATSRERKIPIAFANKYGRGLAVYVACDLSKAYAATNAARGVGGNATAAADTEKFLRDVCASAGLEPHLKLVGEDGLPPAFTRCALFRNGNVKYYGIVRNYVLAADFAKQPAKVRITFPEKGYVREVLSNKDFGQVGEVDAWFTPNLLQIYSVTPYETTAMSVKLAKDTVAPGEAVAYEVGLTTTAPAGNHVLRVNVIEPDGAESRAYSLNLTARAGKASGVIPLALNDKKGAWRIQVKDLTSGREAQAALTVQ